MARPRGSSVSIPAHSRPAKFTATCPSRSTRTASTPSSSSAAPTRPTRTNCSSKEAYGDNVLALGGRHEFPYSYNSLGLKYLWQIGPDTEFRAGATYSTIDFRDSFPQSTVFQPNFTEFPIYNAAFKHRFNDKLKIDLEAHYQDPQLKNNEIDARICQIPRLGDLPADIQAIAANQGITGFSTAASHTRPLPHPYRGCPAGCVTNPYGSAGSAGDDNWNGGSSFYINQDPDSPFYGQPYGTVDNPFPIGAPIGYVVQSTASFGDGGLTKGFGTTDQRESGYVDYGFNARATYTLNDYVEIVAGVQNTSYKDNSDDSFGVRDVKLTSTGVYGDLRLSLPVLEGFSGSFAARQDFNDNFDDQSVWKVGLRQNFGHGLYARGSGGTSYSLPKIDEIGAFGAGANINPGLQPQEVDAFNVGAGIDGDIFGGTYNVELGYFETDIKNLFSSRAVGAVCLEYANNLANPLFDNLTNDTAAIEQNRRNIIAPDEFCRTAASGQSDPGESVAVNAWQIRTSRVSPSTWLSISTNGRPTSAILTWNRWSQTRCTEPSPGWTAQRLTLTSSSPVMRVTRSSVSPQNALSGRCLVW
jgi:iron complex outermembrane receptor protein